ncbi:UNVERIFIED_CONTAM: hypothetical protein PYX00_011227 [Menopon gallinae]|uniref:Sulfatase-modifying factor enzyme-like domain-containing protein n=1 Tax=Menopon gallinae TaxID=328185 RepID=A0AAW2H6K4_9NEOP
MISPRLGADTPGELVGLTPLKMKITQERKGLGQLRLERQGFQAINKELKLTSWPFPLSFLGDQYLDLEMPVAWSDKELVRSYLKEVSYWSSQEESRKSRPCPNVFSDFIKAFKRSVPICKDFLKASFPLINNKFLWQDFSYAYSLLFSQELEHKWESWLSLKKNLLLSDSEFFIFYLHAKSLEQKVLSEKEDFKELLLNLQKDSNLIQEETGSLILPKNLKQAFFKVSARKLSLSEEKRNLPCVVSKELLRPSDIYLQSFYLSRKPVSKKELSTFLQELTYWQSKYRQSLIDKGLADENYLKDDYWLNGQEEDPAYYVPYYLAQAYAEWYSQTYLKGFGLKAKLPSTFQWRCLEGKLEPNDSSLPFGQWFWMRDPHLSNLAWLRTPENPYAVAEDFPSWEGEIRALSKAELGLTHSICASLPRHWCGPYLGFYLVIEKDNSYERP